MILIAYVLNILKLMMKNIIYLAINDETCINESYVTLGTKITLDEFMEKAEEFFITFNWNNEDVVGL